MIIIHCDICGEVVVESQREALESIPILIENKKPVVGMHQGDMQSDIRPEPDFWVRISLEKYVLCKNCQKQVLHVISEAIRGATANC